MTLVLLFVFAFSIAEKMRGLLAPAAPITAAGYGPGIGEGDELGAVRGRILGEGWRWAWMGGGLGTGLALGGDIDLGIFVPS